MARIASQSYEMARLDSMSPHPDNPNTGDVDAIQDSIEANDFYGVVVVQKSTGFILAGTHRYLAAKAAGLAELPAVLVDVDDDQARRILVVDNQTARLASWSEADLADLLSDLAVSPGELAGTGFVTSDMEDLLRRTGKLSEQATSFLDDYMSHVDESRAGLGESGARGQVVGQDQSGSPDGEALGRPAEPVPAGSEPQPERDVEHVQVSWIITPEERDRVRVALRSAQELWNLETSAAALVALAGEFVARHPAEPAA